MIPSDTKNPRLDLRNSIESIIIGSQDRCNETNNASENLAVYSILVNQTN